MSVQVASVLGTQFLQVIKWKNNTKDNTYGGLETWLLYDLYLELLRHLLYQGSLKVVLLGKIQLQASYST